MTGADNLYSVVEDENSVHGTDKKAPVNQAKIRSKYHGMAFHRPFRRIKKFRLMSCFRVF